jgi:hypothetical protein
VKTQPSSTEGRVNLESVFFRKPGIVWELAKNISGSCMMTDREPSGREMSAAESRYRTTGDGTAG